MGINLMHPSFDRDREAVIRRAEEAGVSPLIITGTGVDSSRDASCYAEQYGKNHSPRKLYATAGVHPHDAKACGGDTIAMLRELAGRAEVIAIGECGLDYNRDFSPRPVQRQWFEKQVELAAELGMPLFLHERDAFEDFSGVLKNASGRLKNFVVHCFTGTGSELDRYLSLGAHIGITGWICDERRGGHLGALVPRIPPDRLMVETDGPFLLPRNLPQTAPDAGEGGGKKRTPKSGRNEPAFLPHIVRTLAGALGKDAEQLASETLANTLRFFGIE
jgi:TatD DNase family protein